MTEHARAQWKQWKGENERRSWSCDLPVSSTESRFFFRLAYELYLTAIKMVFPQATQTPPMTHFRPRYPAFALEISEYAALRHETLMSVRTKAVFRK